MVIPSGEANAQLLAHLPEVSIYFAQRGCKEPRMFEHLVQFNPGVTSPEMFIELDDAEPGEVLSAQHKTVEWLEELGVRPDDEIDTEQQTAAARTAFGTLTTTATEADQKVNLIQLKTPEAVRHLTGMLAAYDWEFVQQAKEIRGYAVAQLIEETKSTNANIRLKALGLLGKVTEVGLFTDKIEVKKAELSDSEIDAKIKEKLSKFMGVIDVVDVSEKPVEDIDEPKQPDDINEG
jgi:hypothetical protein